MEDAIHICPTHPGILAPRCRDLCRRFRGKEPSSTVRPLLHPIYRSPVHSPFLLIWLPWDLPSLCNTLYARHNGGEPLTGFRLVNSPMCVGVILISILGGYVLHLIPGTVLVIVAGLGWVLPSILFAVGSELLGLRLPIDGLCDHRHRYNFQCGQHLITTNLSSKRQGLAGALINSLLHSGIAVLLAFAGFVQTQTESLGLKRSYQSVFWYQLACAATALVIMAGFVRLRKAESGLTVDEKEALAAHNSPVLFRARTS